MINLITLKRLGKIIIRHASWSMRTFGLDSERGPMGPLLHLRKETFEIEAELNDKACYNGACTQNCGMGYCKNDEKLKLEYVDAFFLLLDSYRRAGFTMEELADGMLEKLSINEQRTWVVGDVNSPVEHKR